MAQEKKPAADRPTEIPTATKEKFDRVQRIVRNLADDGEREALFDVLGDEFCLDCGALLPAEDSDEDHQDECPYGVDDDDEDEDDDSEPPPSGGEQETPE